MEQDQQHSQQVEQTSSTPNDTMISALPPKKKRRSLLMVILVFVLALAILSGVTAWLVLRNTAETPLVTDSSNEPAQSTFDPASKLPQYMAKLKEQYHNIESTRMNGEDHGGVVTYSSKIDRFVELPSPANWSGLVSVESKDWSDRSNQKPYESLVAMLKADGMTEYTEERTWKSLLNDGVFVRLQQGDVVCEVGTFAQDRVTFDCARKSDLTKATEEIQPFYEAYAKSKDADSTTLLETLLGINSKSVKQSVDFPEYETILGG